MLRQLLAGAALAAATTCAGPALAWNCRGHMLVAAVAWQHIDPAKHARLDALLRGNPNSAAWLAGAGTMDPTQAMFIRAACWPDDIKSDADHKDPAPGKPDPLPDNNTGYTDPWRHREWHFKDIPFSTDGTALVPATGATAEAEIEKFRTSLTSAPNDDVRSYDLVWLIHLVGDVHQPLHATSRFTSGQPKGDGGGNKVCLTGPLFHGQCPNLHSYWDDILGSTTTVSAANKYVTATGTAALPKPKASAVADTDVAHWLAASEKLAETKVYRPPILNGSGPYDLTTPSPTVKSYHDGAVGLARSQINLAGQRLAKLINDNLT